MDHQVIEYRSAETELGWLQLAATRRGICQLRFGEDPERLVQELEAEFPYAQLERDTGRLLPWLESLQALLRGEARDLRLPLDVRGSCFQRRVWSAIRAIPAGATCSYGELAAAIGRPGAARAVAGACGANPVALLTPCHRVVASGGGLGGYRYGGWRKRALLALEARAQGAPLTAMANSVPDSSSLMERRSLREPFSA